MLKVKDNIDLKELEKFGFEKENNEYYNACPIKDTIHSFDYMSAHICINADNREVTLYVSAFDWISKEISLDKVYELIQAGFIEKI